MFLKEFVGDTPWLHLDIASTAWNDDAKAWIASGPTGHCGAHNHGVGADVRVKSTDDG